MDSDKPSAQEVTYLNESLDRAIKNNDPLADLIDLIKRGAHPNIALEKALTVSSDFIKFLIAEGSNIFQVDRELKTLNNGKGLLYKAMLQHHDKLKDNPPLRVLLENGLLPDETTIFRTFRFEKNFVFVEFLRHGTNVDAPLDDEGSTPLIFMCEQGHQHKYVKQLVEEYGADVNARNKKRQTPLMTLFCNKFLYEENVKNIMHILLQNGANPLATDYDGRSVVNYTPGSEPQPNGSKTYAEILQEGINHYRCFVCSQYNGKDLTLVKCHLGHQSNFICTNCISKLKAPINRCPTCKDQLS